MVCILRSPSSSTSRSALPLGGPLCTHHTMALQQSVLQQSALQQSRSFSSLPANVLSLSAASSKLGPSAHTTGQRARPQSRETKTGLSAVTPHEAPPMVLQQSALQQSYAITSAHVPSLSALRPTSQWPQCPGGPRAAGLSAFSPTSDVIGPTSPAVPVVPVPISPGLSVGCPSPLAHEPASF